MSSTSIHFKIKSYMQLIRLNQPIGIFLLLWPTFWALCTSGDGLIQKTNIIIFLIGIITMRSAGCVINDYFDSDLDKKVKRTKMRPLASGSVSQFEAMILFMILTLTSASLLFFLNIKSFWCALFILPFVLTYPLMKRLTFLPQLHLAFTFSWGIPMAYSANNVAIDLTFFHLFLANMVLVLIYDTQYALADQEFDVKAGIRSSAILFASDTSLVIIILQTLFLVLVFQIGVLEKLNQFFFFTLPIILVIFYFQHQLIKKNSLESSIRAFKTNNIIGLVIFCGLLIGYDIP